MKKFGTILMGFFAFVLVLAVIAGLVFNVRAYQGMNQNTGSLKELKDEVFRLRANADTVQENISTLQTDVSEVRDTLTQFQSGGEDVGQEDDVVIAGSYTIRSTLPISEAYISGDTSDLDDKQKETLDMAASVLDQIITEGMSDYGKEKAVYEWMTENLNRDPGLLTVIPQTQEDCDNPYGVLKYHNAVCVGYATTFRLFMQMLEIPCKVCHNTERYHSWDLVQLNGGWYHTDIYSDVGNASFAHFNMTDVIWGREQSWNREYFPAADSNEFCYACMDAVDEKDIFHVPQALREALDNHSSLCSLRFDSSLTEVDAQIVENMLNEIYSRLDNSAAYPMNMTWNWVPLDKGFVLAISLAWYDGGDDPDPAVIPDDAYEKMNTAVEDAFGDIEVYYWEDTSTNYETEADWNDFQPVG